MKTTLTIQESAELIKRGVSADKASMVCMDFNGTYAYVFGDEEQTVRYCVNDQFYVEENRVFTLADLFSLLPKEIDVDFPNADGGIDTEDCCLCTQWCINGDYADNHQWCVFYTPGFQVVGDSCAKELIDALYKCLIWAIDHNHVKLG